MSMVDVNSIQSGWDVYGSDGEKIGDVSDIGANYVLVTKGFLFTKDIYIPMSAISGIEQDRVYVNASKDQIDNMGWDQAPMEDTGYTAQTSGVTNYETTAAMDNDAIMTSQTTTTADTDYVVAQPVQTQTTDVVDDDTLRVRRYEEELQAQKVAREAGAVRVSKDVVEEQQTLEVPVTREEVHVRSVTVDRAATDTTDAFKEGVIEVPVREEDVTVSKSARVAEELEIEKRAVQETERVTDTVRKERVNIEQVGDVDVEGGTSGTIRR